MYTQVILVVLITFISGGSSRMCYHGSTCEEGAGTPFPQECANVKDHSCFRTDYDYDSKQCSSWGCTDEYVPTYERVAECTKKIRVEGRTGEWECICRNENCNKPEEYNSEDNHDSFRSY